MKIIITGSSGYIGSCLYECLKKKHEVFGIDKNIFQIKKQKNFFRCDLLNYNKFNKIINTIKPDIIIHLAAQSTIDFIKDKNKYNQNNTIATNNVIKSINKNKIKHLIFSSTAAVYKASNKLLKENSIKQPNNIYGKTKLRCENNILKKTNKKNTNFIIFRFFNVCSSLYSQKVGELHNPETHLIPIMVSKFKKNKKIYIYGKNFKTEDKTCIRDYIHIRDITNAFEKGIKYLQKKKKSEIINLGTKKGLSTLSIFKTLKKNFNYKFKKPFYKKNRVGDVDKLICDNQKSLKILNWRPKYSNISRIIKDEIKWVNFIEKKKIHRKTIY